MRKYTEKELYAFVYRADTNAKIMQACDWLMAHYNDDPALFDDLMQALVWQHRELNNSPIFCG